jgi:FMN phosphatase YigB (HAD superfamily)
MPSKALLLDVDGVILNQPRVLHKLGHKAVQFVQQHVPGKRNILQAAEINTMLYTTFGHTHRGLRHVYGKQVPPLATFNQFVYDKDLLSYLMIHDHDDILKQRGEQIKHLVEYAISHNVPCYLFSNAPDIWCNTILDMLSISTLIPSHQRMTSSHPVFQENLLKPDATLYKNVATFIEQTHHDNLQLLFVDDSLTNLTPIIDSPGWKPVLLKATDATLISDKLYHAQQLHEVTALI